MKQYIYTPEECGIEQFAEGTLRLEGQVTQDPDEADVFVVPQALFKFTDKNDLARLRYMHWLPTSDYRKNGGTERRHVFLDLSEHFTTYTLNSSIFIRAALTKQMLEWGPNSISWPWPVKDYKDCVATDGFTYDVTFHGWLSNLVRKVSSASCRHSSQLSSNIMTYESFFGYQDAAEQARRDALYRLGMRQSRVVLTQESIPGVIPYRFYEAMSAGRCQLYIGRNYNLPFADRIPYNNFVDFLDIDAAMDADKSVKDWITRYNDRQLLAKGKEARFYWETWLRPEHWVNMMTRAVESKLQSYL